MGRNKPDLATAIKRMTKAMSKLAASFSGVYSKGYYIANHRGRNKLISLREKQ